METRAYILDASVDGNNMGLPSSVNELSTEARDGITNLEGAFQT